MCGLVGVISKNRNGFYKKQIEIFASLLFIDYFRGQDSTGVFLVDNSGDVMIAKEASNPIEFMNSREFDAIIKQADRKGSALIGHNRKATKGQVNDENAHPFWVDDKIVLVHNGTMYGDHKKHADVEVDSHAIAHIIHENNGDVEKALSSFDAAYALIWYDFEAKRLNITRNTQRPLWWIETGTEWIIASEKCFLDFVIGKFNINGYKGPNEFTANDLQMFDLDNSTFKGSYRSLNIKKQIQSVWPSNHGRQTYVTWPDEDDIPYQDVPFELKPTERLREALARQQQEEKAVQVETKQDDDSNVHVLNILTHEYERDLASNSNRIIPSGQFYSDVINRYPKGSEVVAVAFDYTYANQKDSKGGYYLYLNVWDDRDIICRVWFNEKTGNGRIEQMAGTGYVYKLQIDRKWWASLRKETEKSPTTPGYTVLQCNMKELLYGGGIGDKEWAHKLTNGVMKH